MFSCCFFVTFLLFHTISILSSTTPVPPSHRRSFPSPKGYWHEKSSDYYHSIRSQPTDSLIDRFAEHYAKVVTNGQVNGYLSQDGVPYHSKETLMVEAPDYGHETTSEAYSEYVWLTAMNIFMTDGDTTDFEAAWANLEKYIIPSSSMQPNSDGYSPDTPATYAPEEDTPRDYPVSLDRSVTTGRDPLYQELKNAYNTADIYATHWLLDVDNIYQFGDKEDGSTSARNVFINTFQRGSNESVWRTLPNPDWEAFKYGGKCGFLELFTYDSQYACDQQWKFTGAPDADSRTIQATYWAYNFTNGGVSQLVEKASKLGDYIRYAMFDKYFKLVPCYSTSCPAASNSNGMNATLNLIAWYLAWGGPINNNYWGFRIGASHAHQGYQNAMTAWVLSQVPDFKPKSKNGASQWNTVKDHTLQFWEWLQSMEGGIAGGCTNSWDGKYANPAADGITGYFYGMPYTWEPVYADPPSNNWFGMQAWSQERNAEYCYVASDSRACSVVKKWVAWVMTMKDQILLPNNDFQIPSNLEWSGQPVNYTGSPHSNPNLHVKVVDYSKDVGVGSALAHALTYWAAYAGDADVQTLAREILDRIYMYADSFGVATEEERKDYVGNAYGDGFWEVVYVPNNLPNGDNDFGHYPRGEAIKPGQTFLDLRSWYKNDPMWPIVANAKASNTVPVFTYHRMWAQAEYGIALADYVRLFGSTSRYAMKDKDLYFEGYAEYKLKFQQ